MSGEGGGAMRRIRKRIGGFARTLVDLLRRNGYFALLVAALILVFGFVLWRFLEWQSIASGLNPKEGVDAETKAFQTLAQVIGGSFSL